MEAAPADADVLVVGAGPTGMVLALTLQRRGVPVRLIERSQERRPGSRALSLNPASQLIFERLGVLAPLLSLGRPLHRATVVYQGARLAALDFRRLRASAHFLMLPQWHTEEVLEQAVRAAGIRLESGTSLVALHEDGCRLIATSETGGQRESRRHRYVVGCDGARSVVRTSQSIGWAGRDYPMHMLLGDVRVAWDGPRDQGFYLVEEHGFVILLPLSGQHHRVVVSVPGELEGAQPPTFAALERAVHTCLGERLRLSDPSWLSHAPFYNRLAQSFRAGSVFLAGDAAHLFSPIGGFGMNTGIGDAFGLALRLAEVLKGRAQEELLSQYAEQRLALARRLIDTNERFTSLIARLGQHTEDDELTWLPLAKNRPFLRALPHTASGFASLDPWLLEAPSAGLTEEVAWNNSSP